MSAQSNDPHEPPKKETPEIIPAVPKKKIIGRPFQKGVSGNPGGKARLMPEMRKDLRDATPEVIKNLIRIAKLESSSGKTLPSIVRAAETVLGYVLGKPREHIELTGAGGGPIEFADLSTEQLAQVRTIYSAAMAAKKQAA